LPATASASSSMAAPGMELVQAHLKIQVAYESEWRVGCVLGPDGRQKAD
jgi:hypothetical protein